MNSFLPLGSIVADENVTLMIIGYLPMKDDTVFPYSAVQYPTGIIDNEIIIIDDISNFNVLYQGFEENDSKQFREKSFEIYNRFKTEHDEI